MMTTMKKAYSSPKFNVISITPAILNTTVSGGGYGENGAAAQSIRLFDDEENDDDFASDF